MVIAQSSDKFKHLKLLKLNQSTQQKNEQNSDHQLIVVLPF